MSTLKDQLNSACSCNGPVPPTDTQSGKVSATCKLRFSDGTYGATASGCNNTTTPIYDGKTLVPRESGYSYKVDPTGETLTVSAPCTTVCGTQKGTPVWVVTPSS